MTTNEAAERLLSAIYMATGGSTHSDKYTIWQNRLDAALAAERRAMLSLLAGPDDRVTGADYKRAAQTLADYRAEERRATVERIRTGSRALMYRSGKNEVIAVDALALILDEEAAR